MAIFLDRLTPLETMCFDRMPSLSRLTFADLFPDAKTLSNVPKVLEQFKASSSDKKRNEAQRLCDEAVDLDLTANDLRQKSAYWSEMVSKHSLPLELILKFPQHSLISEARVKLRRAVHNAFEAYPRIWKKVDDGRKPGEREWDFTDRLADEMSKLASERRSAARQLDGSELTAHQMDRSSLKDKIFTSIKHVLHLS